MIGPDERPEPRYWFSKRYADLVQRLRVLCGFLLLFLFAWLSHPSHASMLVGLPIACFGLAVRAWAAGHLAKDQQLAVTGPYAYLRNPLYAGTLITALGVVIAARDLWLATLFTGVFLLVYLPAMELEEQHLREIFPSYGDYAARVPKLFPSRKRTREPGRFAWSRYRRNQEYKALIGFLLAVAWLVWKCWRAETPA